MRGGIGQNFYSLFLQYVKTAKQRTLVAINLFFIMFAWVIVRLFQLMVIDGGVAKKYDNAVPAIISRADILDRNGSIVATSLPTVSAYACPHEILDVDEAVGKICFVFKEMNKKDLRKKILSSKKFLWVKRNLTPQQEQALLNQGIPGVRFLKTERRVYPDQNLFAHVIGGTDVDNIGIAGIEKVFDEPLRYSKCPIVLSVDVKIQHAVRDELLKSIAEFRAVGGAAIVMDIATGEIISLVSLPDFDPNKNANPEAKERFNMVTSSAIEPGSSAKIFNTAMALESGKITPFTQFDARFPLKIGRFTVNDFKGKARFLSMEEVLKYSSNIGSGKIALEIGAAAQKKFYKHIGLLDSVACELLETQHPLYPRRWSDASAITISYGHGIAFSPLHLITIFSGIVNDGILNDPTLLKRNSASKNRRIVCTKTSKQLHALLRLNVIEGTNKFANVPGYSVGGKSGSAEKAKGGRYSKHLNYCGFIGAFPMISPRYAVYVVLDEPKATPKTHGYATAGWNAVPTSGRIIKRIGSMLNIVANEKEQNWSDVLKCETAKKKY